MKLAGLKILMPVEDLYNDLEFWYPKLRLEEEGIEVVIAAPEANHIYKSKIGMPVTSDAAFSELSAIEFDGVVIAGGYAPDKIRRNNDALELVRALHADNKLVAHICHAGWVPISAGIMTGITTTSYVAIKDDLINAGANWVDKEVVIDANMVSSRTPDDLPAFMRAVLKVLKEQ